MLVYHSSLSKVCVMFLAVLTLEDMRSKDSNSLSPICPTRGQ